MKNDAWNIVSRLKEKSLVTSKWLFKIKHFVDDSIEKYKAGFMTRGLTQKEGVDYGDTLPLELIHIYLQRWDGNYIIWI